MPEPGAHRFAGCPAPFVRDQPDGKKTQQLIWGDYVALKGEENGDWIKVRGRNTDGWMRQAATLTLVPLPMRRRRTLVAHASALGSCDLKLTASG